MYSGEETLFLKSSKSSSNDRLFRLAEEYGKIKAEVYIDKTITDLIKKFWINCHM